MSNKLSEPEDTINKNKRIADLERQVGDLKKENAINSAFDQAQMNVDEGAADAFMYSDFMF